jgi:hypothetical protein
MVSLLDFKAGFVDSRVARIHVHIAQLSFFAPNSILIRQRKPSFRVSDRFASCSRHRGRFHSSDVLFAPFDSAPSSLLASRVALQRSGRALSKLLVTTFRLQHVS